MHKAHVLGYSTQNINFFTIIKLNVFIRIFDFTNINHGPCKNSVGNFWVTLLVLGYHRLLS